MRPAPDTNQARSAQKPIPGGCCGSEKQNTMNLFDNLNQLARSISLPAGAVLFRRDEPAQSVYVVRSGRIALLWPDAEGSAPMETLGPGTTIGLPAAMNGIYSITATSLVKSELGVISVARVLELLEGHPPLCREALKLIGQEVARIRSSITEHSSLCAPDSCS